MSVNFETIGYSIDYLVDGKYKGSLSIKEKDREVFGYNGRRKEILKTPIVFKNGKKIKAGVLVTTELFPVNGRVINN